MPKDRWTLLDSIQDRLKKTSDLPEGALYAIAAGIEDAISASSSTQLRNASEQLTELFAKLLQVAEPEAASAAVGNSLLESATSSAYTLGQISFAQLLATQAAEHRIDDAFLGAIYDIRYARYVDALSLADLSGKDLAAKIDECPETVSRKIKHLRELGVTDFRREGTCLVNFLTPAARALTGKRTAAQLTSAPRTSQPASRLLTLKRSVPEHFRGTPSFAEKKAA